MFNILRSNKYTTKYIKKMYPYENYIRYRKYTNSKRDNKVNQFSNSRFKLSNINIMKIMLKYLWPESKSMKIRVCASVGCLIGAKIIGIQVPFIFKYAIDNLNNSLNAFTKEGVIMAIPFAILIGWGIARTTSSLLNECRTAIFAPIAQDGIRRIARKSFLHIHNMDLSFHISKKTGALSRALDRGQKSINYVMNSLIFNIFPIVFEISLVFGILGYNCGIQYSIISALTISIYSIFTLLITKWRTKLRVSMNSLDNLANSKLIDSLLNYETIKYFNNEQKEVEKYDSYLKKYQNISLKVNTSLSLLNWGQNFIFTVGLTSVMILASHSIVMGNMTIGDLVMINGLLFQLTYPLNFIGSTYREMNHAFVDLETILAIVSQKPNIKEEKDCEDLKVNQGRIVFKDIHFSYRNNDFILNGTTFEVPAGKSVAIVGLSGSGKSTLQRLLYRFYDPNNGRIIIDGQDISKVSLNSLRKNIGVVPQDISLFNETIYYNIAYGNLEATREDVIKAAKKAKIHETILKMTDGYNTMVGERGLKISGGEKQRIAIARMILKSPKIIIWDEATSSLDSETESKILESIKSIVNNKTAIFIAHRLSTIIDVDIIFVLENGKIVEKGNYKELSKKDGVFNNLLRMQNRDNLL